MELSTILEWFSLPLVTAAILAIGGFLLRVPITSYISGFVQLGFDKKLEEAKAAIRSNEKELEGINTFLVSRQSQRSAAFESKKLEAAEDLMVSLKKLASLSMFAEMMKILKIEEIKKSSNSTEVKQMFETLSMGLNLDKGIEDLKEVDLTKSRLYLSERALQYFDAYSLLMSHAAIFTKAMSSGIADGLVMKDDALSKKIIEVIPYSKEGFEKYGEGYAYYWTQYLYDQLVKELRMEVSGSAMQQEDVETVAKITSSSVNAQLQARQLIEAVNLPAEFIVEIKAG